MFKVGDQIMIHDSDNYYNITKDGATGTIKEIKGKQMIVSFDPHTLTLDPGVEPLYWVETKFCLLVAQGSLDIVNPILKKMSYLNEKFNLSQQYKKEHHA